MPLPASAAGPRGCVENGRGKGRAREDRGGGGGVEEGSHLGS